MLILKKGKELYLNKMNGISREYIKGILLKFHKQKKINKDGNINYKELYMKMTI